MRYIFKSKAGYPATPYDPATTWVVVGHDLDVTNAPALFQDDLTTPVNWAGTDTHGILAVAVKNYGFFPTVAKSSDPEDDDETNTTKIRQFLVEKAGTKYFTEAVKYSWFLAATFPVTFEGYTTKSGTISSNESWDGVYVITSDVTINSGVTVDVAAGSVIKWDANTAAPEMTITGTFDVNGASDNLVYFDDCRNTIFDDTTSAECSGSPTVGNGAYSFNMGATSTTTIDWAEFWYWGSDAASYSAAESLFYGISWTGATFDMSDVYFHYSGEIIQRWMNTGDAGGPNTVSVENFVIEWHNKDTSTAVSVGTYIDINASASSTCSFKNGFIWGNLGTAVFSGRSADITKWTIDYFTFKDYSETSGVDISQVANSLSTISNSIIYTAANVEGAAGHAANNIGCYDVTVTTECDWTDDPVFATGSHTYVFSYDAGVLDFHLNSSTSPYFDDADETSSAAGLDALHTSSNGDTDSGTADLGFHFPVPTGGIGAPVRRVIMTQLDR